MTNQNITIIGTVHVDLDGQERLENLLEQLKPDVVAVEISEKRVDKLRAFRKNYKKEAQEQIDFIRNLNLGFTEQHLAVLKEVSEQDAKIGGFEYFAPEAYASKHLDTKIILIDTVIQDIEKEMLLKVLEETLKEVMSVPSSRKKFLNQLELGTDHVLEQRRKKTKKWYQASGLASLIYDMMLKQHHYSFSAQGKFKKIIYNPERDPVMEGHVRQAYSQNPESNIAIVVGGVHLYPFSRRLKDLNPEIMTLAEWNSAKTQAYRRINEGIHYAIPKLQKGAEKVKKFFGYLKK